MNLFNKYTIILLMFFCGLNAQKKDVTPSFADDYDVIKKGDTLSITLEDIHILPKNKFKSRIDKNYYYWFRKKVHKAYPYAVLAAKRLDSLKTRLVKIKSSRKRKKYSKMVQHYVEKQFTSQLKELTRTEGRILIKLLHRQTGFTAYQIIGELRSGFKAFMYHAQAKLFSMSLKEEYKPATVNEDYLIEDVLQRSFQDGTLEEQNTKLDFDIDKIFSKNKGKVDVEKYKAMFSKQLRRKLRKQKRNNN